MKLILIVIAILMLAVPTFAADTTKNDAPEICFSVEDGKAILKDLEGYDACMEAVNACDGNLESETKRADALEERMEEQEEEIARAERLVEDTRKAGEQAAKGSWWSRLKSNASYMGLGAILGIVAVLVL